MTTISSPFGAGSRLKNLIRQQILDSDQEVEFDGMAKLASILTSTSTGLIYFFDEEKVWVKSSFGNPEKIKAADLETSFLPLQTSELLLKGGSEGELGENLAKKGIKFFAGIPIKDDQGVLLAAIAVLDKEEKNLSNDQLGIEAPTWS